MLWKPRTRLDALMEAARYKMHQSTWLGCLEHGFSRMWCSNTRFGRIFAYLTQDGWSKSRTLLPLWKESLLGAVGCHAPHKSISPTRIASQHLAKVRQARVTARVSPETVLQKSFLKNVKQE